LGHRTMVTHGVDKIAAVAITEEINATFLMSKLPEMENKSK